MVQPFPNCECRVAVIGRLGTGNSLDMSAGWNIMSVWSAAKLPRQQHLGDCSDTIGDIARRGSGQATARKV